MVLKSMSWGDILQVLAVVFTVLAALSAFFGGKLTDKSYLESFRSLKVGIEQATSRKQVEWTPFVLVDASDQIPPVDHLVVRVEVHLHSDDIRVPLMARVASDFSGEFSETISGPAGVAQIMISVPQTYYVSVSHPSIRWRSQVIGWEQ